VKLAISSPDEDLPTEKYRNLISHGRLWIDRQLAGHHSQNSPIGYQPVSEPLQGSTSSQTSSPDRGPSSWMAQGPAALDLTGEFVNAVVRRARV
jgi:hypothetical protein